MLRWLLIACFGLLLTTSQAFAVASLSEHDRRIYTQAFELLDQNLPHQALELAAKARNPLPYKAIQWLFYSSPRSGAEFTDIASFMQAHPHWPGTRLLQRRAEEELGRTDASNISGLIRWFDAYPPISAEGSILYTDALLEAGQKDKAVRLIRETWVEGGFGSAHESTIHRKFGSFISTADHVARLDRLLWERQAAAARRMLKRVPAGYRALANARIRLMLQRAGVDNAIDNVPAHLQDDPGLLFERMRWRRRKRLYDAALEILSNPPRNLVRPNLWWRERNYLTREALQRGDVSLAYRVARDHRLTEGVGFATSEFLAGWISLRMLRDTGTAYNHFARLYRGVSYPISLARGSYWAGRAAQAAGDDKLARGWYETGAQFVTTYYGQLAAARLGAWRSMRLQAAPLPAASDQRSFKNKEMVAVIELLVTLAQAERIDPFFEQLTNDLDKPGDYVLLARLAEWSDRYDLALRVAKKAALLGIPMPEHSYPVISLPELPDGPEPALVLAVIRQESAYDKAAVSSAGARGMMQLLPRTARIVAKRIGLPYSRSRLTRDPEYNILLGAGYLAGLLERFNGSYVMALAGYNAGPGRVDQWVRDYGDPHSAEVDPVDWIEMIPFSETRNYVQRILESLQIYRHRLRGKDLALHLDRDLTRQIVGGEGSDR